MAKTPARRKRIDYSDIPASTPEQLAAFRRRPPRRPYDAPWSQRQAAQMFAALVECARIVALLDDAGDGRTVRALHQELRRVLADVGLMTAKRSKR